MTIIMLTFETKTPARNAETILILFNNTTQYMDSFNHGHM